MNVQPQSIPKNTKLILFSIIFWALGSSVLFAQTGPGGVSENLQGWWKADGQIYSDAGTTLATNSDPIYQWSDFSSNGNNFIQVNSGERPLFSAATLNFNPQAIFDGTEFMDASATTGLPNGNSARFMRLVTTSTASFTGNHVPFAHGTGTQDQAHVIAGSTNSNSLLYGSWEAVNDVTSPNFWTLDQPHIIGGGYDGVSNTYLQANGTTLETRDGARPTWNTVNSLMRIGADVATTAGEFWTGNIAEVLVYDTYPTVIEQQQIDSYLALKYGISLDQTSDFDYLASDGSIIWDASNNTGYKNDIFGIGRDDDSGLNQKISKSVNTGAILTIALDVNFTASNINANRTTEHGNDKQFLILSNNGETITNTYAEIDGTNYNSHISKIWKTNATTNFSQSVNLKFNGFDETWALLKDDDGDFSSGASSLGTLDSNGEITGVVLANVQFLTLAKVEKGPGGITSNMALWLRADSGIILDTGVSIWEDQSLGQNNPVQAIANSQPIIGSETINFNPKVSFDGSNDIMNFDNDLGLTGTNAYTIFGIMNIPNAGSKTAILATDGCGDGFAWYQESVGAGSGLIGITQCGTTASFGNAVIANEITLRTATRTFNGGHDFYKEGGNKVTDIGLNFASQNMALGNTNGIYSDIHLSELIVFNTDLSETERQKVHTYLSLKYGVTLDQTSGINYLASDGTVIWDASNNTGYEKDIFGIGRDDDSGLNQKVSKSVNSGAILTMALNADFTSANNDAGRSTEHTNDKQFLILSNNGEAITNTYAEIAGTNYNSHISKVWKTNPTNFSQSVNLKFNGFDETWALLIDDDGDFSSGASSLGTLDSNGEITGVVLANVRFLTLAKLVSGPGGVLTDLKLWLKADDNGTTITDGNTVDTWFNRGGAINGNFINGGDPSYENDPNNTLNFNPVIDFDGDDYFLNNDTNFDLTGLGAHTYTVISKFTGTADPGSYDAFFGPNALYTNAVEFIMNSSNEIRFKRYGEGVDIVTEGVNRNRPNMIGASRNASGLGKFYNNGKIITANTNNGNWNDSARYYVGASYNIGLLKGTMPELLVYNRELSSTERQRVESYLSIKYGLSLDQSTATDYLASDGTITWDASNNSGYNNDIFGIGRDDNSSLNQKVSKSVNSGSILTMALDANFTASNTDASRTTEHGNDKQFLMVANNGAALTTQVTELEAASGFNIRLAREWKVEATNFSQNISLKFEGYDDTWSLIATPDGNFSVGVSTLGVLNAEGEFTTTAPLADGISFTLARVQEAPGGQFTDLTIWLKADYGTFESGSEVTVDGATIDQWNNQADNKLTHFSESEAADNASIVQNGLNYHSVVRSGGADKFISQGTNSPDDFLDADANTAYIVFKRNSSASPANVIFQYREGNDIGSGDTANQFNLEGNPAFFSAPNQSIQSSEGSNLDDNAFRLWSMLDTDDANGDNNTIFSLGLEKVNQVNAGNIGLSSGDFYIGGYELDTQFSDIDIAEFILFENQHDDSTRKRIESYLALKYGFSLDQTNPTDYIDSEGNIIWDASNNTGYKTDIFGIGRDDASGLNQKVAKSVNSGAVLTMALDNNFILSNTDSGRNTEHTNDKQFLVIANNGGATTTQTIEILPSSYNTRVIREWKVDKTANFSENVNLKFDGFDETWSLVKDDDGDFSTGITTLGTLDSSGEITEVTLADGDYLTLAKNDVIVPTITSFTPEFAGNGEVVTITGTGFTGTSAVTFGGVNATSFTVNSDIEIVANVNTGTSGDITITNSAGNDSTSGYIYKVAQYDFEGNANDTTENNYDGTEVNVVTYETGAQGQALCFDNGPGFVKLPDNLIRSLSEFTISLRFKTTGTGSILGYQNVQANVSNNPSNYIPILLITSDGKLKGTLWTSTSTSIQAISSSTVNDGNWHQVDFTAGTNSVSIYLDGSLEANTTGAAVAHLDMIYNQLGFAHTNQYNLSATTWEYFNGCIDDMVIFDRKLTEAEIETVTELPEPTIISFDPVEAGQEDTVVITGTNFDGATQVTFGGIDAASYTVDSSTQITAVLGNTAASGDVEVVTAGGTATLSGFTFTSKTSVTTSVSSLNSIIYCGGETSSALDFDVSASDAYQDMVITAPSGFEISLNENSGFASSLTLSPVANAIVNTTIYVRVAASQSGRLSGNVAIASGTVTENISVNAETNNSLYFDGIDDYVNLTSITIPDGASDFTIEAWILPDNSNWDGDYHAIIGNQQGAIETRNPSFYIIDGKIHIDSYEDNTLTRFPFLETNPSILQNVWSHIALVKDGLQFIVYVNGQEVITAPAPGAINITAPYQFGFIDNYFAGKIDDVRFWSDSRTASEITNNMNTALMGNEAGLIGHYNFNEGVTEGNNIGLTTLPDNTASANAGTLNNFALTGITSNWVQGYFSQISGNATVAIGVQTQLTHLESGGVWASNDNGIATVNQSGVVTGVALGTAEISYTLCGQTTIKNIEVNNPPGFTLNQTNLTIAENGGTETFTVVLNTEPTSDVVFDISSDDTDEATVSLAQLTFTSANWDTPQTITVTGVDDAIDRDDSATITVSVNDSGSDNTFDALADQTVAITLTDDDTAAYTVSKTTLTIDENAGVDTFTVVLDTEPTSDVVFDISSDDTGEATISSAQLTFTVTNWDTPQTVTVTGVDDAIDRNDTATITIAVNDAGSDDTFDTLADKSVAITLTDDDTDTDGDGILDPSDNCVSVSNANQLDTDSDGEGDVCDTDDDGDGTPDTDDAFPLDENEDTDTDGDGTGDNADTDDDGDGTPDTDDAFPLDPSEDTDTDGDGTGDNADTDDDGDGTPDTDDAFPLDDSEDTDTDNDGTGDNADTDDDGDGTPDVDDAFPLDENEDTDTDGDGTGDNADTDDDGDGTPDTDDAFPLDPSEDTDTDGDGTGDNADTDDDGDGTPDTDDAFPLDDSEDTDTDNDGTGDNADTDDDGDGTPDVDDAFPLDENEDTDNDGDGTGDNADTDDDGDGTPDTDDAFPLDDSEDTDTDGDGTGDNADTDDDGDGTPDTDDAFPKDDSEDTDTDGDGQGDNSDDDIDGDGIPNNEDLYPNGDIIDTDNDGIPDVDDAFPNDPNESIDSDGDGQGDNSDPDDDNDGTPDSEDAFPLDSSEDTDTDGDGTGDNIDNDIDGDGIPNDEDIYPNGEITDTDNDGVPDSEDAFPNDPNESVDGDGDGIGDNADPDDDNDGVPDTEDKFPWDPTEDADTDGDGTGDNADTDDDNDGIPDNDDDFPRESEPLIVPAEAFTPNGDGNNDTWVVPGIGNYPNNVVRVYNRSGHEVFAVKGYRNDWTGSYGDNREKLPAGSYLYVIDLGDGSAPLQGWIFINY
ncbi:LamG-like jellyroll fold domain-containing protein [Pareuzebyella sediminis]|uniref:LamG-like jellyroll fold domain-containing protein n=1 Tax=Pareuzebyella sediminis TaxID=2607998 RepID=UPI0011ED6798|nr:LamG-like jellyroll fold domain-containing protein [Pareuzebyella sediminis]